MLLNHLAVDENSEQHGSLADVVVQTCEEARVRWLAYRDAVAQRMGIAREAA
jgi:hypothetical protein